ncbi:MAG: D-glycerate dehydrogenase [Calditrichaeota bacterium]|nr:MAG: D-glycerate dehydrogenase [Calditrichota bacterium]
MKVFVTRRIPSVGIELLREHFQVELNDSSTPLSAGELKEKVKSCDALLSLVTDPITADVIAAGQNLKIISNHGVGYDNIDVAAATSRGIAVTNTPDVLTDATADFTWALLLAITRRVVEGDRVVRNGEFTGWDPLFMLGADLVGKTLGILGAGRIGTAVGERSVGWRMKLLYYDHKTNPTLEAKAGARKASLKEILQEADIITVHLPLTEQTYHLIGKKEFEMMKPTAYLVNTARGAIIDEAALVEALKTKRIAGAALDVFEHEPQLTPGLAELNNVVLAPHLGSATTDTRNKMAEVAARNIILYFQGKQPISIINPEVLKKRKI